MEYIYSAMLLHSAKKPIEEAQVTKIIEAAGIKADSAKVKALVASLKDVNIEEAIKTPLFSAAPAPAAEGKPAEKKEEKKAEDDKKSAEEAAAGLGALFG